MASVGLNYARAIHGARTAPPPDTAECVKQAIRSTRLNFVQKVFGIVAAQLFVTTALCCVAMFVPSVRSYVISTWDSVGVRGAWGWHDFASFILPFFFLFTSWACQHRHPHNLVSIFFFTLSSSWGVARTCAVLYEVGLGQSIALAAGLTAFATASITLFALLSKKDFSYWRAGLFVSLLTFCASGTIALVCQYTGWPYPYAFHHACGVVLFSLYLLYDVHMLSTTLSVDDYIPAAIAIYLDILNLFLQLLSLIVRALAEEADKKKKDKQ
jgi:protein lifeguard